MVLAISLQTEPAGIDPGPHMIVGSRCPPSQVENLYPRRGRALPPRPPPNFHGPLSEV